MSEKHQLERVVTIVCLIIAGEAVFSLPFHVARFFRPTVLQVFDFTNTELGAVQAVYGMVAMLAYFPGGPLADRFPARRLLTGSLLCTSVGGLYFATFPGYRGMWLLFAYWGLTTILLFWAALIRATREWGGPGKQGRAYGLLDGGRGL
ncbi:MAG: MFS transporter, partial [Deltaproteobacteria bacterium]|nr:MFS transporter [Deltaproteobacteria bacterium]